MNLDTWVELGRQHWKEFTPKRYKALKKAGLLEEALKYAANQTYLAVTQLEDVGFHPDEAWQMVREEYLILRAEDDPSADKPIRGIQSLNQPPPLSQQMAQAVRTGKREMKIG